MTESQDRIMDGLSVKGFAEIQTSATQFSSMGMGPGRQLGVQSAAERFTTRRWRPIQPIMSGSTFMGTIAAGGSGDLTLGQILRRALRRVSVLQWIYTLDQMGTSTILRVAGVELSSRLSIPEL